MIRHIVILPYADGDGPALVKRGRCGARPPAVVLWQSNLPYPRDVNPGFVDRGTDREQPIIGWAESERFKAARAARAFPLFPARALVVAFEGEVLDEGIDRLARVAVRVGDGLAAMVATLVHNENGQAFHRATAQLFQNVIADVGLAIFLDAEGREIEP